MPYENLESWFSHAPGKLILQAENHALEKILPDLLGFYFLQLGGPSGFNLLKGCRIPHCFHLGKAHNCNFPGACTIGDYEELPFAPDSVDAVLLPHVLEFSANPKQILQQTYDIVAPEGHVIILGFQPFTLRQFHRHIAELSATPKRAEFLSAFRVRRWLTELDFTIVEYRTLFFRPPLTDTAWLKKLFFIELIGQLFWPYLGSVYLIVAKKSVESGIAIKTKAFTKRMPVRAGVVQPTRHVTRRV